MSWTRITTFGGRASYRHDGVTDDFCAALLNGNTPAEIDRVSAGVNYTVTSLFANHLVRVTIRSSLDGRQCIQAGIVDDVFLAALGTSVSVGLYAVVLRKDSSGLSTFDYDSAYTLLARSANDLVTEGILTTTTDRDVLIEARTQSGRLKLYINGTAALTNEATTDYLLTSSDFPYHPCFGFTSHVNQAVAKHPNRAALIPQRGTTVQLTAIVSGGELYVSTNGGRPERKGVVAAPDSDVSAAYGDGYVFFVDGQNFYYYDYPNDEVQKMRPDGPDNVNDYWTVGGGTLTGAPVGALSDPADTVNRRLTGTTTATQVAIYGKRLYLGSQLTLQASRLGDFFEFNDGAVDDGRSFTLNNENSTNVIRSPIICLHPHEQNYMLVGCMGEVHALTGDLVLEGGSIVNITRDCGPAGPDAASTGEQGYTWLLTEQGLQRVNGLGIVPVSQDTLTIDISKGGDWISYKPKVVRDSANQGIEICYTGLTADATITHFWYDEQSQGLFPETFPAQLGPTAVGKVNNVLLYGSRNGYVYVMDTSQASDDMATLDGGDTSIATTCPVGLIMDTDGRYLTMTTQAVLSLSNNSGSVSLSWYVGRTPEDAYTITTALRTDTVTAGRTVIPVRASGGAIVPVITSSSAAWCMDYLHIETLAGGLIPALPRPSTSAGVSSNPGFGDGDAPGGGGGDGPIGGAGGGGDIMGVPWPVLAQIFDEIPGQEIFNFSGDGFDLPVFSTAPYGNPANPETPGVTDVGQGPSNPPGGDPGVPGGGGIDIGGIDFGTVQVVHN